MAGCLPFHRRDQRSARRIGGSRRRKSPRRGASIKQVVHDRAFAGSDVSAVHVLCTVETRNREHLAMLRKRLREHGVETYDSP